MIITRAPAAIARQILSTVAKTLNSTEHFVNLNADVLTPLYLGVLW